MTANTPENLGEQVQKDYDNLKSTVEKNIDASNVNRINMAENVVKKILLKPAENMISNWDAIKKQFNYDDKAMVEKFAEKSKAVINYINSLTPDEMRLTTENLAKMQQQAQTFADMLSADITLESDKQKYPWVKEGLSYVLKIGPSKPDAKLKTFISISENLDNKTDEKAAAFARTMMTMAKPEERMQMVKFHLYKKAGIAIKDNDVIPTDADAFTKLEGEKLKITKDEILELNKFGVVSPAEMDELLPGKFTDEESQKASKLWEEKYDLVKKGKFLAQPIYGTSYDMFTFKNLGKLFGYIAGSCTMLFNGLANYENIKKDPLSLFSLPQFWIGAAEFGGAAYLSTEKTMGEITAGADTKKGWDATKAREALFTVTSASPRGWKTMIEANQFGGVNVLNDYVLNQTKNDKLQEDQLSVADFKAFLEMDKGKNSDKYGAVLATLESTTKAEGDPTLSNERFKKICKSFSTLRISNQSSYDKALAEAKK